MQGFKQTEIGPIPTSWKVTIIEEVLIDSKYGISKKCSDTGKYPVLRMTNQVNGRISGSNVVYTDLTDTEFQKSKVEKNDILFNRTNSFELVGRTAIFALDGDYSFASYLIRLRVNNKMIDPHFLNHYLNMEDTQKRLKSIATRAVSQSNISATRLKGFNIPLPPIPEQKAIARVLSKVQQAIAAQQALIERTTELKKALMEQLFTQGTKGEALKETEIGWVPESWEVLRMKELNTTIQSGNTPSRKNKELYGNEYYWVKTLDLNEGKVISTEEMVSEEGFINLGKKLRPVDTVMVAMYGGKGTVGKSGILGVQATTNQAVCCIEPNPSKFSSNYLLQYMIFFRKEWMKFAIGTRKDPNISKNTIQNTFIPLPPMKEQLAIAKKLGLFDSKLGFVKAKKQKLESLFKSLLHELMTGQRRVQLANHSSTVREEKTIHYASP